jgi:hypothetical protein
VNPTSYSTDYLLRIAGSVDGPSADRRDGLLEYRTVSGWTVVVSAHAEARGAIDHFLSPEGEFIAPGDWPEFPDGEPNPDRTRLLEWRIGNRVETKRIRR